jgi:hypothetical protein
MILKSLYRITRILAIMAILYMMLFSLDLFGGQPFPRQNFGFLILNIPTLLLIIALVIAWENEIIGGMIYVFLFIAFSFYWGSSWRNTGYKLIVFPLLFIGILFILHHILSAKGKK